MSTPASDLLMHPVRIRLVNALYGDRALTTAELCERLPGVSQATVYRHVAALVKGGILQVTGEEQVRGTVERRYALRRDRVRFDEPAAARMTKNDHRLVFTAALGALIAEFNAYLDRRGANPLRDAVSYRQFVAWLTDEELGALVAQVGALLQGIAANTPRDDRTPYLLSTILFPTEQRAQSD